MEGFDCPPLFIIACLEVWRQNTTLHQLYPLNRPEEPRVDKRLAQIRVDLNCAFRPMDGTGPNLLGQ